jgi:radical SAM protein with 4Fe4S-binding SPASM domain
MNLSGLLNRGMPRSFIFEVTADCNLDCPHCYNVWKGDPRYPSGHLDTDRTLALLGLMIRQMNPSYVTLTGGEPFMRRDLVEIVDFLHTRKIAINLISNGSLISDAVVAQYRGKIQVWELPLLSHRREIHDRLGGAGKVFDRVTYAVAALKAAGQTVVVVFVATAHNLGDFRQTAELAAALGADGMMLNRFNPGGRGFTNLDQLQISPNQLTDLLRQADEFAAESGMSISCSVPIPPCLIDTSQFKNLSFGFCAAGSSRAYYTLDPLGNVRPCNHSRTILGNINETGLREMIGSQTMRRFRAARPTFCRGCRYEKKCQGNCKAAAEVCYGDPCACEPFLQTFIEQARVIK